MRSQKIFIFLKKFANIMPAQLQNNIKRLQEKKNYLRKCKTLIHMKNESLMLKSLTHFKVLKCIN